MSYIQNFVDTQGTAHLRATDLGAVDSQYLTFCGTFKFNSISSSPFLYDISARTEIKLETSGTGKLDVKIYDNSNTVIYDAISNEDTLAVNVEAHIAVIADFGATPSVKTYFNGDLQTMTETVSASANKVIDHTRGDYGFLSTTGDTQIAKTKVADYFLDFTAAHDIYDLYDDGAPLDISSLGSPAVFLGNTQKATDWNAGANLGDGGALTVSSETFIDYTGPTQKTFNVCDGTAWTATNAVVIGGRRLTSESKYIECVLAGTTSNTEPTLAIVGDRVIDGTVTWKYLCVQDYSIFTDFKADIGVGLSDTLVTDDEVWEVFIWHRREGAYQHTSSGTINFAEACDVTRNLTIRPAKGDSWQEGIHRETDRVCYDENYGVAVEQTANAYVIALNTNTQYCTVYNIQAKMMNGISYAFSVYGGSLISGCLAYQPDIYADTRQCYVGQQASFHNCIGISAQTADDGEIFSCGWSIKLSNCLAIYIGTAPTGQAGFTFSHDSVTIINCIAVN
ncbi:MAG: hypothetical protein COB29_13995, partial [Sulfitobacter sp.]